MLRRLLFWSFGLVLVCSQPAVSRAQDLSPGKIADDYDQLLRAKGVSVNRDEGSVSMRYYRDRSVKEQIDVVCAGFPAKSIRKLGNCGRIDETDLLQLKRLPELRVLTVSQCPTTDKMLAVLPEACPGIEELNLPHGEFSEESLVHLKRLPQLRRLILGSRQAIEGTGLAGLKLESITLRSTALTDEGLRSLKDQPLKILKVGGRRLQISPEGLAVLKESPLVELEFSHMNLDRKWIEALRGFPIKVLMIIDCGISDSDLKMLAEIKTIEELGLYGENLSDHGIRALLELPKLKTIRLPRTSVSLEGLKPFEERGIEVSN